MSVSANAADVVSTLAALVDAGDVTVKQLSMWTGRCERTCYGWLSEEQQPSARDISLIGQRLHLESRLRLATALLRGWGVTVQACEAERSRDLMGEGLQVTRAAQALIDEIHEAEKDGVVDPVESRRITERVVGVVKEAEDVRASVDRPLRMRA